MDYGSLKSTQIFVKIQVTLESFNGLNDCELTVSVNGERLYNQAVRTGVLPCP